MPRHHMSFTGGTSAARRIWPRATPPVLWKDRLLALGRSVACWWRRDQALRELASLDSRTLKDIGLRRGDIWAAAQAYACGTVYPRGREPVETTWHDCRCLSAAAARTPDTRP